MMVRTSISLLDPPSIDQSQKLCSEIINVVIGFDPRRYRRNKPLQRFLIKNSVLPSPRVSSLLSITVMEGFERKCGGSEMEKEANEKEKRWFMRARRLMV
ncbi:hypothetical protein U1Q18_030351 [Sarracenia purpurea var. burkii]